MERNALDSNINRSNLEAGDDEERPPLRAAPPLAENLKELAMR